MSDYTFRKCYALQLVSLVIQFPRLDLSGARFFLAPTILAIYAFFATHLHLMNVVLSFFLNMLAGVSVYQVREPNQIEDSCYGNQPNEQTTVNSSTLQTM